MKTSLPHLASNSSLNNHAHERKSVRSFSKIIFPEIPRYDERYPDRMARKVARDKAKLFRFRKGTVNIEQLSFFRSPHSLKSLKLVTDIRLIHPQSYYINKGVNHLRLLLTKLTKCSVVRLNMGIYGNPEGPEARFSHIWSGIFKELGKYNPRQLKIRMLPNWSRDCRYKSSKDLSWWQYTFGLIETMKNLRFLQLNITVSDKTQFKNHKSRVGEYANHTKYLSHLKEIVIRGVEYITNDYATVYKCLMKSPAIEQVAFKNDKPELSESIAESLDNVQSLKHLTFQGNFEILDLVSVIHTHPDLNTVNAIGSWSHDIKNIPIDALTQEIQLHNITHLYLDLYLPIKSKEHCSFYNKLMEMFVNVESLRIGFDAAQKIDFVDDYADILLPLKKITRLELGLSLTLENMAKFFTQMQPLAILKHFTLAANIQVPRTVAKELPEAIEPLKKFLLSLNSLEFFEIHCHKLDLIFLQGICQVMLGIQKLQSITLSFETNSDKYVPVHDAMITEIQNTVGVITNAQELYVTMICGGVCDIKVPKELVECQNKNLQKFKFMISSKYNIPAYGKRWF